MNKRRRFKIKRRRLRIKQLALFFDLTSLRRYHSKRNSFIRKLIWDKNEGKNE